MDLPSLERLAETTQALYSELLDQTRLADLSGRFDGVPPGSLVSKTIRGRRYWYLQRSEAGVRIQVYLGPESSTLSRWLKEAREHREAIAPDRARARELVAALRRAGAAGPDAASGRVLQVLAERGFFRLGAVLIGTHAFAQYANVLGVRLEGAAIRTADIDLLHDTTFAIALDADAERPDVAEALRDADPEFLAVPPFDRGEASTSFKVRGRDLRVDLLTPLQRRGADIVPLRGLGISAQALPHLGYLLEETDQAVVLYDQGQLVNVPAPARFALHKLWTATERPRAEALEARKDRAQASRLLRILVSDRAVELRSAWESLPKALDRPVRRELEALGFSIEELLASP